MSSGPCPDCFSGTEHEGHPTGSVRTINGLPTYVAEPEEGVTPKGIIVFLPDAFGWTFVNNRLLCDKYAKKGGFLVYLPDFMNGKPLSTESLMLMNKITTPASWITTLFYKPFYIIRALYVSLPAMFGIRSSVTKPRVLAFFKALRSSPPPFQTSNLKIGAAGFCWGGQFVVHLCQNTPSTRIQRHESQSTGTKIESLVNCGFTAHPSFLKVPNDIEKVTLPLSVVVGDNDMALGKKPAQKMHEILEVKIKGDHECVILPDAKHGFAVRATLKDDKQIKYAEQAEKQALDWFTRWLV